MAAGATSLCLTAATIPPPPTPVHHILNGQVIFKWEEKELYFVLLGLIPIRC